MLIICKSCQQQLNLPDERVPPRPFVLTCPSCKTRQQVDPATDAVATGSRPLAALGDTGSRPAMSPRDTGSRPAMGTTDTGSRGIFEEPTEPAPGSRAEAPPLTIGPDGFVAVPALRPHDAQLLAALPREVVITNLAGGPTHQLAAGLQLLGF